MNKVILFIAILLIGGFSVLVMNNKLDQTKTAQNQKSVLSAFSAPANSRSNNTIPQPQPMTPTMEAENVATVSAPPATDVASSSAIDVASISATIETNRGNITLSLFPKDAPNTVNNFVQKARSGFYNNLTFHRVEDWVVQGGDPLGNGTGGGQMPTELNNLPFVVGSLGVARGGDIKVSNNAQFFITKKESSWLNGQYTNFGIVIQGMDVVNSLQIGDKILGITID